MKVARVVNTGDLGKDEAHASNLEWKSDDDE